jgi:Rrf2 family protein
MRISAKGRYALAAAVYMAGCYESGEQITVISISEKLGISKIYLEQVFSLLKRGEIVTSIKGAQGGYRLTRPPKEISAFDILSAVELSLFERAEDTVKENAPEVNDAINCLIFDKADGALNSALKSVNLEMLASDVEKRKSGPEIMYYI